MSNKYDESRQNHYPLNNIVPMIPETPEQTDISEQDIMEIFAKLCDLANLKREFVKLSDETIEYLTKLSDYKGNAITISDAENIISKFLDGKWEVLVEYFKIDKKKQK